MLNVGGEADEQGQGGRGVQVPSVQAEAAVLLRQASTGLHSP